MLIYNTPLHKLELLIVYLPASIESKHYCEYFSDVEMQL